MFAAIQQIDAGDVTSYYVRKGTVYQQTSAAAPTPVDFSPSLFIARLDGNVSAITGVSLATPSDFFPQADLAQTDHFEYTVALDQATLDTFFPTGNYSFTVQPGNIVATLALSAGSPPAAVPQVLNFDAAQKISAGSSFTLNFTPFTGAGAGDAFEFEILTSDGILFQKSGTGASVTIPAGTLTANNSYDARLRFVHNTATDTSSIAGATGSTGYFNETQLSIATTSGGGGGGPDTTPPTLIASLPANGATGVATSSTVTFIFSEPMTPQGTVQWSANVNSALFSYAWGQGNQFLTASYNGSFPANSTITWALPGGTTGFKDVAGNPLASTAQGSFTTGATSGGGGGTTNNACLSTNSAPAGYGGGFLFKALQYTQTGNNTPVPDASSPASAFATYQPATNQTVTAVKITGPTGATITLSNLFGSTFFANQEFPSAAALDGVIIPGNYTITATGAGSGTVAVPATSAIPVPRIVNLAELGSFDPTKDFDLNFAAFTGASGSDTIQIELTGPAGRHFYAPDYCLNRPLANNATTVRIPANTFQTGDQLSGSIAFNRFSINTNTIPKTAIGAGLAATTTFNVTGSSTGTNPSFNTPTINPDGTVTLTATGSAGQTLIIQKSTDLSTWSQVGTASVAGGLASYIVDPKTSGPHAFFRAKVQ